MNIKSPDAFRTIGEVADELDVPQHVLRFWEAKFSHIKPIKRGGGRRYYRPDDVELLRSIRQLLHGNGYTIKGVQKLLRENGAGALRHSVAVKLVGTDETAANNISETPVQSYDAPPPVAGAGDGWGSEIYELAAIVRDLETLRRKLRVD